MNSIQLTESFKASKEELWDAWTLPSFVKKWFGSDPSGSVLYADLDVRPGGKFTITFEDGDGTDHTCSGIYTKVTKFDTLSFGWEWKSEPGHVSNVNIQFLSDNGGVTTMKFEHTDLNPQSLHGYAEGWKSTFDKLKKMFLE